MVGYSLEDQTLTTLWKYLALRLIVVESFQKYRAFVKNLLHYGSGSGDFMQSLSSF